MPIFTQALTVTPGERTTARQFASLAAAFNSRLPYADCLWRVLFCFHSGLFRQMRNPNEGFTAYPADGEWWNFSAHVEPTDGEWPLTGPGDPEGSNIANPMNAFVYGPEALDIGSELYALAAVPTGISGVTELKPRHIWYLGRLQRGVSDPETGATSSVAFDTARRYAYIRQGLTSMHGNAYGGFGARPVSDYIFNQLPAIGSDSRTYATSSYDVSYTPWAYYIFDSSGVIEILSKSEWLEGPYTGESYLRKTSANMLARALSNYASEFRGTEAQGAGTTNRHAFDLQKFLTTQYPLAPNYGEVSGGGVEAIYPSWQRSSNAAAGVQVGGTTTWPGGTVCTGFIFVGEKLTAPCVVELVEDGKVIKTFTVPVGDSDEIWWLPEARRIEGLKVRLASALTIDTGGELYIEANALLEYKPQIHDWYFVTRLSSYNGELNRIDGRGIDFDKAKELGQALYDNGCVIPLVDTGDGLGPAAFDPTFNQNAMYDSTRRWIRSMARIIPRWNLTGYAVEDGKSILWFNRTAQGPTTLMNRDMFDGIGPAQQAITSIKWGRTYKVVLGTIAYGPEGAKVAYSTGQTFRGLLGIALFEGAGTVKEVDGIRQTAEPRDWSNRWLLNVTLKPYTLSNSSLWKVDAFADQITPFWQRCHFRSDELPYTDEYIDHLCPSARDLGTYSVVDFPEAPSQLNFGRIVGSLAGDSYANQWDGSGDPDDVARFYKSCRLYEPSIEIESAVMDGDELKVTLKSRLHSHELAPASLDRDFTTWNTAILDSGGDEDYRTPDNGIREYILWQGTGRNAVYKVGDDSLNSSLQTDPDAPLGCCLPTIMMLKMIPEPYLDGDDKRQEHDSYRTHEYLKQAEVYLRAICEGFVDGVSTAENACNFGYISAFDYTPENLWFQTARNRWVPLDTKVRPDNPFTFGAGPNQKFYVEQYNAIAAGVNLLTDLRIMLPSQIEQRSIEGTSASSIAATDECGDAAPCSAKGTRWFAQSHGSLSATAGATVGAWGNWGGTTGPYSGTSGVGANAGYQMDSTCDGDNWVVSAGIIEQEIRWTLTDPDSVYALPGDLASLLDTNAVITAQFSDVVTITTMLHAATPGSGDLVALTGLCGAVYAWYELTTVMNTTTCGSPVSRLVPPAVPAGAMTNAQWDTSGLPGTLAGSGGSSVRSVSLYSDGTSLVRCPTVAYSGGS